MNAEFEGALQARRGSGMERVKMDYREGREVGPS